MTEELRLVLMIIGGLAIAGLLIHGLWTVRKGDDVEESPLINAQSEKLDNDGFDQFGVGKAKTVGQYSQPSSVEVSQSNEFQKVEPVVSNSDVETTRHEPHFEQDAVSVSPENSGDDFSFSAVDEPAPVASSPEHAASFEQFEQTPMEESLPQESQSNIDAPEAVYEEPVDNSVESAHQEQPEAEEVLILHIVGAENSMPGQSLLPLLLTLGFKFNGGFFHRHQDSSGNGPTLFSLANMYNPGTFDIDSMEQMATAGVSMFMTLPSASDSLQTFNMMHNAAKQISEQFDAQILDNTRSVLTGQTVMHYADKIREFERKRLISG